MIFAYHVGTAEIDLGIPPSNHGKVWCIFKCADPFDLNQPTLRVEMNVDVDGHFHGSLDHINHAERVAAIAHVACYSAWYEQTYDSPFTMSA